MSGLVLQRVNRKAIPPSARSRFSIVAEALRQDVYGAAVERGDSCVVLGTCERFEIYHGPGSPWIATLVNRSLVRACDVTTATGTEALHHLFRVAAGLDSRLRGEDHVLGQVRAAFAEARCRGTGHGAVADMFAHAIRCGRRVRADGAFGSVPPSYAAGTVDLLQRVLAGVVGRRIAVVGTGTLAGELVRALRRAGVSDLTVVGRDEERTAAVAGTLGVCALTLRTLQTVRTAFDAVVTAVPSATPVITPSTLAHCRTSVLVDLGAVPNVDGAIIGTAGVRVFRLEDLGDDESATRGLSTAEATVAREVARCIAARTMHASARRRVNAQRAS